MIDVARKPVPTSVWARGARTGSVSFESQDLPLITSVSAVAGRQGDDWEAEGGEGQYDNGSAAAYHPTHSRLPSSAWRSHATR
jgi:hypothetical protein